MLIVNAAMKGFVYAVRTQVKRCSIGELSFYRLGTNNGTKTIQCYSPNSGIQCDEAKRLPSCRTKVFRLRLSMLRLMNCTDP